MPPLTARIENFLGSRILPSIRGHDNKLLIKSPAFAHIAPTLEVTSPECGPSGSALHVAHTPLGANRFPKLTWHQSSTTMPVGVGTRIVNEEEHRHHAVAEYLVIVEDPDAPLPDPVVHGLYYGIRPDGEEISLHPTDLDQVSMPPRREEKARASVLRGGFDYGLNRRRCVWSGARPVLGHGVHRYFFQVVGLRESLSVEEGALVSKDFLRETLKEGDIVNWGVWVGTFERRFGLNGE